MKRDFKDYPRMLILSTSPWGFPSLWGGGVPTLDIKHYGPRICRLLLLFNIALPLHLFILLFSGFFFYPSSQNCRHRTWIPLFTPSSTSVFVPIWIPLNFHPLPTSSPGEKRRPPGRRPQLSPARHQWLSMRPVPASAAIPVSSLHLHPGPCCTQVPVLG